MLLYIGKGVVQKKNHFHFISKQAMDSYRVFMVLAVALVAVSAI